MDLVAFRLTMTYNKQAVYASDTVDKRWRDLMTVLISSYLILQDFAIGRRSSSEPNLETLYTY